MKDYVVHTILGNGSSGIIYLLEERDGGKYWVGKEVYERNQLEEEILEYFLKEGENFRVLGREEGYMYILPLVKGKGLVDYCNHKKLSCLQRGKMAWKVLVGIWNLHHLGKGICWLDVRGDNIMVDDNQELHFIDFGKSQWWTLENEKEDYKQWERLTIELCGEIPLWLRFRCWLVGLGIAPWLVEVLF